MSKAQRSIVVVLSIAACLLGLGVAEAGLHMLESWPRKAWGQPLPTHPYTPLALPATWTPPPGQVPESGPAFDQEIPSTGPLCGGPPVMYLLLIGSDTRGTGYTWGLADLIRIARIDFVSAGVAVLDFPRDLWVEIPEISDDLAGQDHEKLNQAYLYGNPGDGFGYWDDPSAGPGLLARTLELNFGAPADHYIAVNMRTFVRIVDAVGGIDVDLPHSIQGSDNAHLQAGLHHLDGAEALAVARDRTDGVFKRGENQNLVVCALRDRLTSPAVVPRIPELVASFRDSVQSDLDVAEMGQLACLAAILPAEHIRLYSFPEALLSPSRIYDPVFEQTVFAWEADRLVLSNYVAQFRAGGWPQSADDAGSADKATSCP